jgi:hypothetical protein
MTEGAAAASAGAHQGLHHHTTTAQQQTQRHTGSAYSASCSLSLSLGVDKATMARGGLLLDLQQLRSQGQCRSST